MTHSELLLLAKDPALVKGIYTMCDHWCRYCGATSHCLAYRCDPGAAQMRSGPAIADTDSDPDDNAHDLFEGLMTAKCLADAEGRRPPAEIETMLCGDRERQKRMFSLNDPLERLGRQYMMTAAAYLSTRATDPCEPVRSSAGPTPFEVFVWFHALMPARLFRAIVSDIAAREGVPGRADDALAAAKMALLAIDRSLEALLSLSTESDDPRVELLASLLRRLGPEVERRFPGARRYQRPGLDAPVTRSSSRSWLRRLQSVRSQSRASD